MKITLLHCVVRLLIQVSLVLRGLTGSRIPSGVGAAMGVALILVSGVSGAQSQGFNLQASVDPPQAMPGETMVYSLKISFSNESPPRPSNPQFPAGATLTGGPATSMQTSIINGSVSQTYEYRWGFTLPREGQYTIPPTGFDYNGRRYTSNAVTVTITKAQTAPGLPKELEGKVVAPVVQGNPQLAKQLTGALFIMPVLDVNQVYEGQQLKVAFHLCIDKDAFRRAGIQGDSIAVEQADVPELKQFLKEQLFPFSKDQPFPRTIQFEDRNIGGRTFAVAPLYEAAITPTKSGQLDIEPYKLRIILSLPRRRGGNAFDDQFDDPFFAMSPFFGGARERVIAMSPQMELTVKPLPAAGRPADYSGAVGEFQVSADLDKHAAIVNEDTIQLNVTVTGKGDAGSVNAPKLPPVDGLVVLEDPAASTNVQKENNAVVSTKKFSYKIRATKSGELRIPPIRVSYFDPETGKYHDAHSDALQIEAVGGKGSAVVAAPAQTPGPTPSGTSASNPDETAQAEPAVTVSDLRYIHNTEFTGELGERSAGDDAVFYSLVTAGPLFAAAGWFVGRRRNNYEANRGRYREAAAGAAARKRLRQSRQLVNAGDGVPFFDELGRALRGFFGDKFHLDPSELTIEQIEEELQARGAGEQSITSTRRLLDYADQARYAPSKPDVESRERTYNEAVELLNVLEKLR